MTETAYLQPTFKTVRSALNEEGIIASLSNLDEKTFEQVFKIHVKNLHAYACSIIKDEAVAEEIVQDIFYKIWERPQKLSVTGSVAAYLYRSVHNECLNHLKHLKVKMKYQHYAEHQMKNKTGDASKKIMLQELEGRINKALQKLPEQCRTIFQMSRFEELKYNDIARRLKISPKTVENQMGKALKIMRTQLAEFLPVTIFLLMIFN